MNSTQTIEIPAHLEHLHLAGDFLRELAINTLRDRYNATTVYYCELALQELLTNIVHHAYTDETTSTITVRVGIESNPPRCRIDTEDTGNSANVNLDAVRMPDASSLQEGGYGLALITALMDSINYQRKDGKNMWKLMRMLS